MACIRNILVIHTETTSTLVQYAVVCVPIIYGLVSIGVPRWLLGSISLILGGILPCPSVAVGIAEVAMYSLESEDFLMPRVSTVLVISAWAQIIQLAGVS